MTDDLRTRIAAAIAAHEPATDYNGADGECIECDLNPRWPDAPILPPSDGWKRHAEHLADAVIRELNLATACQSGCIWKIPNHIENMTDAQKELLKRADDE